MQQESRVQTRIARTAAAQRNAGCHRYTPFRPVDLPGRTWPAKSITRAPRWLSTDLRDGKPGTDRPDEPGPQAQDVRAPGPDGLQGDRGRVPGLGPDRLRLHPRADRGGPDPGRRPDLGADPGQGRPDRALGPSRSSARIWPPCTCTTPPRRSSARSCSASTARSARRSASRGTRHVMKYAEQYLDGTDFGYEYSPRSSWTPNSTSRWTSARASWTSGKPGPGREIILNLRARSSGPRRTSTPTRSSG